MKQLRILKSEIRVSANHLMEDGFCFDLRVTGISFRGGAFSR
jgi:hypothetical protein